MTRPPIERVQTLILQEGDPMGHVWPIGDGLWVYPCRGCGADVGTGLASAICQRPYQDPVVIAKLLVEVRDLLRELVAKSVPL